MNNFLGVELTEKEEHVINAIEFQLLKQGKDYSTESILKELIGRAKYKERCDITIEALNHYNYQNTSVKICANMVKEILGVNDGNMLKEILEEINEGNNKK